MSTPEIRDHLNRIEAKIEMIYAKIEQRSVDLARVEERQASATTQMKAIWGLVALVFGHMIQSVFFK